jgi:hypothetical protein
VGGAEILQVVLSGYSGWINFHSSARITILVKHVTDPAVVCGNLACVH